MNPSIILADEPTANLDTQNSLMFIEILKTFKQLNKTVIIATHDVLFEEVAVADRFVCIADESKLVNTLGRFPLPVEVIPMAAQQIARRFAQMGGRAQLRLKDGQPLVTDNGQHILDVQGLQISEPLAFESQVNQWPGVVTVGVFAHQKAHVCLLGTAQGVRTLEWAVPASSV